MGITDLDEQFTFYAAYHHSNLNKLIHILCVWPIVWSLLVLLNYVPLSLPIPIPLHPANLTLAIGLFYMGVYVIMDKRAGTLAALMVLGCLLTARQFYLGVPNAWQTALVMQGVCWIAQFVGHGIFEGRAPALLDNLMQAFVMAPLFVLLEVLFFFGYRKDFQEKMWKRVEQEVKKFRESKINKGQKK